MDNSPPRNNSLQKKLLSRYQSRSERGPVDYLGRRLYYDIKELKERNLELDPQWITIWNELNKKIDRRYLPINYWNEIESAIKSIKIIDDEIFKIRLSPTDQVTFLLGAGASVPSNIPAVNGLLSELWDRARRIGREDIDKLIEWCTEHRVTNIEDLLTAAYISNFAAQKESVISLLNYFLFSGGQKADDSDEEYYMRRPLTKESQIDVSSISFIQDTLQTLFSLLTSTMIHAKPNKAHESIVDLVKKHKKISIITTNYDGCMDEAILRANLTIKDMSQIKENKNDSENDSVELIKMHGSINWTYCDSCQDVRSFDLLKLKEAYEKDTLSYPVMGICKNCGGLRKPMLVPPLSFKFINFPNLIDLWNSAKNSIFDSSYIVAVGYSFSEADTYITKLISQSMAIHKNQKIIIVTTDTALTSLLRKRFESHIDSFDPKRILQANESCELILPKILPSFTNTSLESLGRKKRGRPSNYSTYYSTSEEE